MHGALRHALKQHAAWTLLLLLLSWLHAQLLWDLTRGGLLLLRVLVVLVHSWLGSSHQALELLLLAAR